MAERDPRDLLLLTRFENELVKALGEAVQAYHRVNALRDLVDSLRVVTEAT